MEISIDPRVKNENLKIRNVTLQKFCLNFQCNIFESNLLILFFLWSMNNVNEKNPPQINCNESRAKIQKAKKKKSIMRPERTHPRGRNIYSIVTSWSVVNLPEHARGSFFHIEISPRLKPAVPTVIWRAFPILSGKHYLGVRREKKRKKNYSSAPS